MPWVDIADGESGLSARNKLNALGRGSSPVVGTETALYYLEGVDLNTTDDQKLTKLHDFGEYIALRVIALHPSVAVGSSTVGGIYAGASKTGASIIPATQNWSGMVNTSRYVSFPMSANVGPQNGDLYVSLTTAMGSPATCDVIVMGIILP